MKPAAKTTLRVVVALVALVLVVALIGGGWFYTRLRASLPQLDGNAAVPGLATAGATIERDHLGVSVIRAGNRADVARALGFVHAQERFFQMDLMRRRAAGELAEIIGAAALPLDKDNRRHGFRALAQQVLAQLPADDRTVIDAYTAGVNAGLASLGTKPFEYYLLRVTPSPWKAEDSILVAYSMTLELEDGNGGYERTVSTLRDTLGKDALAFFAPTVGPTDAAIDGTTAPLPPIPSASVLNLRTTKPDGVGMLPSVPSAEMLAALERDGLAAGSNSIALSGAHTATGAALLESDMHLNLGVPNTWYRASLVWPRQNTPAGTAGDAALHRVSGMTLPGIPFVVAGSNGRVAWGYTVAYADTGDLITVSAAYPENLYHVPGTDELKKMETRHEVIHVKGAADVTMDYDWTIWGPIIGQGWKNRPLAHRWVAYDPAACNLAIRGLETAESTPAALAVAHRAGIPTLNFLVADADGRIGWTIQGKLPRRFGFDGRSATEWTYGDRGWKGYLAENEVPTAITPAVPGVGTVTPSLEGRLWTANNRLVGGDALALAGDGGYMRAARGVQVRDGLAHLEKAAPKDLLAIALDDRALLMERWQKLLLATLTPEAISRNSARGELRTAVEKWEGHASIESVSYRLAHDFRANVARRTFTPIFASCVENNPGFRWNSLNYEEPLWTLLHEKPPHLLDAQFATWDDLLLAAADDVMSNLAKQHETLTTATWGQRNTTHIRHPFARILPAFLTSWLNMPSHPLPGDVDMPRVQSPDFGASERFVVSPGHETEGIMHMPGGASGHPLSPYYRAGHEAWERGEPTPFLPGPAEHTLTLRP